VVDLKTRLVAIVGVVEMGSIAKVARIEPEASVKW
jgi:hypothetical protein